MRPTGAKGYSRYDHVRSRYAVMSCEDEGRDKGKGRVQLLPIRSE